MEHSRCCHSHLSDTSECPDASLSTCAEWWCRNGPETLWSVITLRLCVLPRFPAFPHSFKFLSPPGLRGHSLLTSTLTLGYFPFLTPPINHFSQILVFGSSPGRKQMKPGRHAESDLHYTLWNYSLAPFYR